MKANNWKRLGSGTKLDGLANVIVLGAGLVVVLFAIVPADTMVSDRSAARENAAAQYAGNANAATGAGAPAGPQKG